MARVHLARFAFTCVCQGRLAAFPTSLEGDEERLQGRNGMLRVTGSRSAWDNGGGGRKARGREAD
ncbi:hypothetical protein CHLRE_14g613075v5 [Chlamydomonas reinhardtii]|uniref:Uncharacterized protein n=1 Tax=Chlamydomonas reinhardtii TaxID=3055 RepID=A0A2K3CXD4_CHLRE|nr:uncharacterized protein CHLRE_14g613075v5 [Chlamydomonas reinhardtii]PNW72952.1 hypothetical protein CHLRE_14g613075v5 [Chlamydomonas reinhardtii]